jgi:hypothetical protein
MIVAATKYSLAPERIEAGTRGSYGIEKLEFAFSSDWDGLVISVVFYPSRGKPVKVPYLGGEIDIPPEVMAYDGTAQYVLAGTLIDEEGHVERQIISLKGYIVVDNTLSARGGNTGKLTPDVYDKFLDEASKQITKTVENALEEAKESGDFQGEKGDPGEMLESITQKTYTDFDGIVRHTVTVKTTGGKTESFTVSDGEKGDKGDPFRYDDFTAAQLESLKGAKGDPFEYADFTEEQLEGLTGPQGEPGVFVKESESDVPADDDTVMVDVTADEEEIIEIPDSLEREGDYVWLKCDGERIGNGVILKDGKNFRILGYYSSLDALRSAVPTPEIGDAYGIGVSAPYDVYVFDGVTNDWKNNGSLAGIAGSDGVGIESIAQTTESTASGGKNIVAVTLTNGTKQTFVFYNGKDGSNGQSINLSIGTVTTGSAGSQASASLTGTFPNMKLNLVIPRGDTGAGANITVDGTMSDSSSNAVQNKVIKAYVDNVIGNIGAVLDAILGGEA